MPRRVLNTLDGQLITMTSALEQDIIVPADRMNNVVSFGGIGLGIVALWARTRRRGLPGRPPGSSGGLTVGGSRPSTIHEVFMPE